MAGRGIMRRLTRPRGHTLTYLEKLELRRRNAVQYEKVYANGTELVAVQPGVPTGVAPALRHADCYDTPRDSITFPELKGKANYAVHALVEYFRTHKTPELTDADRIVATLSCVLRERMFKRHVVGTRLFPWDLQAQIRMVVARPFGMIQFYRLVCEIVGGLKSPPDSESFDVYIEGSYRAIMNMYTVVDGQPKFLAQRYGPCIDMEVAIDNSPTVDMSAFTAALRRARRARLDLQEKYDSGLRKAYKEAQTEVKAGARTPIPEYWMRGHLRSPNRPTNMSNEHVQCDKEYNTYLAALAALWKPFLHVPWCFMAPLNMDHAVRFAISADLLDGPEARIASVDRHEDVGAQPISSVGWVDSPRGDMKMQRTRHQGLLDMCAAGALNTFIKRNRDAPMTGDSRADSIVVMLARLLRSEWSRNPHHPNTRDLQTQIFLTITRPYTMTRFFTALAQRLRNYDGDKRNILMAFTEDSTLAVMSTHKGGRANYGFVCVPKRGCFHMYTTLIHQEVLDWIDGQDPDPSIFANQGGALMRYQKAKRRYTEAKNSRSPDVRRLEQIALANLALAWSTVLDRPNSECVYVRLHNQ